MTVDLARDAQNHPLIVGVPLLISGRADTSTTVTYRYFLRDLLPTNATAMFAPGSVLVTFDGTWRSVGTTALGNANATGLTAGFTIDPAAPGAKTSGGPINLGPLQLQGPTIGIADFGFADGMVVLTIAVGVDRASLAFGGTPAAPTGGQAAQTSSGVTVDLLGILGTFDLAVDVFGLLSGNVRIEPTGKWNLRVASLEATVPNVAVLLATGITVGYDPNGAVDQELVRVNSATITFPRFGITGSIRPYDPATSSNIAKNNDEALGAGVIPGLVVRGNGFSLGTVELAYGLPPSQVQPGNTLATTAGRPEDQLRRHPRARRHPGRHLRPDA